LEECVPGQIKAIALKKAYMPKASPWRRLGAALRRHPSADALWAVNGVDLALGPGEALGLLGRNGSGKSTLLRLLAGAADPDGGSLSVHGRVGSLLELGAGLHPEFKGADNARLQGRLRGLDGDALEAYLHEVRRFSGLGEAWELPCKGYSAGMSARLGFACAISIQPEILLVDEALSVGDEAFQDRCQERIRSLLAQGSLLVLASHSRELLSKFCGQAIVLEQGRAVYSGALEGAFQAHEALQKQRQP
jgi:lipopolysaccharide transport system ATP-binding protein